MSFRYNSRIDRARSRLTLTSPDHSQSVLKISADPVRPTCSQASAN